MSTLAATLGVLGGLGVLLIALGLRPGPPRTDTARPDRREWVTSWQLPSPERVVGMAGAGLLVLVVTRWPVIAVAAAATVWWLTKGEKRTLSSQIDKTDALATWAEQLRDATGTPRGIEGVIVTTTDTAPQPIRAAVTRFAERLKYRTIGDELPVLADDLDDPNGDLIVAALGLAATSGGRDIRSVLDNLAASARSEARMRRRLEVSRQRPRSEMRQVIAIVVMVVGVLSVTSRSYLAPYSTVGGQLVLAVAAGLWIVGFVAMSRLGRIPPVKRFLVRKDTL